MTRRLLVTITNRTDGAPIPTAGVRICDTCGRPVAARDKNEYTAARAQLVVDKGLCVCPAQAPVRAPSLM
jgi:hypothetical protein